MKKKKITYFALAVLLGVGFLAVWNYYNRISYMQNALEAGYQRSFFDLVKHVENLDVLLSKSLVSSSNKGNIITLTSIWHEAENARASIDQIPVGLKLQQSQKYFAQIGDFAYTLAKQNVEGKTIDKKDWDKLLELRNQTRKLNRELHELQNRIASGRISWGNMDKTGIKQKISRTTPEPMGELMFKIDERLKEEAPTLVYDGPFSDHVEQAKPMGVTGDLVSREEARDKAERFIDNPKGIDYSIVFKGDANGSIPAYSFIIKPPGAAGDENILLDISKKGGHVIWYINPRGINQPKITLKDAIEKAENFISSRNYKQMVATGSLREGDVITVTFAHKQDGVIIYPDFIKVSVALDNGEVIAFDSQGYLFSHRTRNLPPPKLSEEDIRKRIKDELKIERIRKAVIPSPSKKEIFCYEVKVEFNNEKYLIYINAVTGDEETILQVIESPSGTITL